ncbi:hypothetical protein [Pseudomonas yamanorum]|uniref:hypothetical protein n=1 Tax=Pseudomonas yamanorum TaxID=515393 RepID=UPI003D361DCA
MSIKPPDPIAAQNQAQYCLTVAIAEHPQAHSLSRGARLERLRLPHFYTETLQQLAASLDL